jgi:hypothetical protein
MEKETLIEIGFIEIGNWQIDPNTNNLNPNYFTSEYNFEPNSLYAFTYEYDNTEMELAYIGKTSKTIISRFQGYSKPGKKQQTNIRVNSEIINKIHEGFIVRIFILPDNPQLQWKGYNLNIAAGIEDSLIQGLNPKWNIHGNANSVKRLNTQEELELIVESDDNAMNHPPNHNNELSDFEVPRIDGIYFKVHLKMYYYNSNQGTMNPGVNASPYLGEHGENSILYLPNNIELTSIINRTANNTNAVRFHWGAELSQFYRDNFNLNDILLFQIINRNNIKFISHIIQ